MPATAPALSPETVAPAAGPAQAPAIAASGTEAEAGPVRVKVIPVRDQIGKPILYVLRRGLKEAQEAGMRAVIIDMDTPGGELGVTLEIMEALDKFEGETVVYVNKEAISAGAIISAVADKVYFAPGGVIGAAEVVMGTGADVADGMKRKVNSFMNAKIRAYNEGDRLRGEVIKAMMDPEYEFKVGEKVIKPKGELLSLTAEEAAAQHGEPARPLFSSGTFAKLDDLLDAKYGKGGYEIARLEVSWSEEVAAWLSKIAPLLMGAGLLCVFIEFKTPGFGVLGITGGLLLGLVFFGHYIAGLSGHEPALFFALGAALVAVELFFFPGTIVFGLSGAALMLGALVWSMVDVWPNEPMSVNFGGDALLAPLLNLLAGLAIACAGALALWRFLPRGWFLTRIAVAGGAGLPAQLAGVAPEAGAEADSLLGRLGVATTDLRPGGQVEVEGRRYEARCEVDAIAAGARVRVTARRDFSLVVEEVRS